MDLVKLAKKIRKEFLECKSKYEDISKTIKDGVFEMKCLQDEIEELMKKKDEWQSKVAPLLPQKEEALITLRQAEGKVKLLEEQLGKSLDSLK